MRLTAEDLYQQGIVEKVFWEPEEYTVRNIHQVITPLERELEEFLNRYEVMSREELTERRYQRFRQL